MATVIPESSKLAENTLAVVPEEKDWGKQCGRFSCYHEDIWWAHYGDGWFEGSVISVLAETFMREEGDSVQAYHITPLVLHTIGRIMDHIKPAEDRAEAMKWIERQLVTVCVFCDYSCMFTWSTNAPYICSAVI